MIKWIKSFFTLENNAKYRCLVRQAMKDVSSKDLLNILKSNQLSRWDGEMIVTELLTRLVDESERKND